jgi:hypothetical protein
MPENYILYSNVPSDKTIKKQLDKSIKRIDEISNGIKNYEHKKSKKSIFYNLAKGISEKGG